MTGIGSATKPTTTLSSHVLDAALGCPAVGLEAVLDNETTAITDADGRIAFDVDLAPGDHQLSFTTGAWFAAAGRDTFFPSVSVAFRSTSEPHFHVAVLLSPFAYTTYRGS